ncbi:hypothetical protein [Neptunicoccus cionae]|uniref:hypothetical protein n=1 Tax=Neptunicoccus cionae TaxID=2035344 RepID=UPI00257045DF|nr:hypothetical protein [Amylibacter cionae]
MSELQTPPVKTVLMSILIAGLVGETLFEAYAWLVSPQIFGFALQPSKLVMAITAKVFGIQLEYSTAFVLHFLIGSIGFGTFVYLVRLVLGLQGWMSGVLSGVALWFVAQGILAPFIGRSFMMDFGAYTQSSFIGHVGMALVMAYLLELFLTRPAVEMTP